MIKCVQKIGNQYFDHFINEINFINYLTNIFIEDPLSGQGSKNDWRSLQIKHEKILKKSDIKTLLKGLGIFPEQYFSFDNSQEDAGVNISHEFYEKNMAKDDLLLMGDNKIKSTRDSLGINNKSFNEEKKKKALSYNYNNIQYRHLSDYRNNTILGIMQCNQEILENGKETDCDLQKQKIQNLHHYKLITEIIEKHLSNEKQHPLACLKRKFVNFFINYYKGLQTDIMKFDDLCKQEKYLKIIYEDSIRDLQQFIRLYQETVAIYYGLYTYKTHIRQPNFFCKDNLLNFITSILFAECQVYDLLLGLQILQETHSEAVISENLNKTQNWTLENFKVPPKFCLKKRALMIGLKLDDKKTTGFLSYSQLESPDDNAKSQGTPLYTSKTANLTPLIEEIAKEEFRSKSLCSANFKNNIINLSYDEVFLNLGENIIRRSQYLSPKNRMNVEEEKEPFYLAIRNLKKIQNIKSPILKLKNIIKTSVLMIDAINRFYQKHKLQPDYQVESDDILSLFIYICSRANVPNLFSQCKLTEKFLTCKISHSISGYYLITLMASLSFFAEKNIKKY